jgi:hypothetical protein
MNVRLLHLNHRTPRARDFEQLIAHGVADVVEEIFLFGVVIVADRRADQFWRNRAELHRTRRQPLCELPRGRVVQRSA